MGGQENGQLLWRGYYLKDETKTGDGGRNVKCGLGWILCFRGCAGEAGLLELLDKRAPEDEIDGCLTDVGCPFLIKKVEQARSRAKKGLEGIGANRERLEERLADYRARHEELRERIRLAKGSERKKLVEEQRRLQGGIGSTVGWLKKLDRFLGTED